MKTIRDIVEESVNEVETEYFSNESVNQRFSNVIDEYGEVDYDEMVSALIETTTHYSNSVLLTTLEKLSDEGRLN